MAKDLTGTMLGKYQVMERLGRGGMADVYRAYQASMDRYVAIKVMHTHLTEDTSFLTRFKREAQSVGNLRHPNIVQVIDFDVQDDEYYMVMEYIQGNTLKAMMTGQGALPIPQALTITAKLADALVYAHSQGVIHRDIKPANIMLTRPDTPILTDFGIARIMDSSGLTTSGATIGTPVYMSPEAGRGEKVDERADIYSLGVVLYEMITGKVPYDADTPYAVILKHISEPLPLPRELVPDLPDSVEKVMVKALAKTPEDRFQTAAAFRDALNQAAADLAIEKVTEVSKQTAPAGVTRRSKAENERTVVGQPPSSRKGLLVAGIVVALIILLAGGFLLLRSIKAGSPGSGSPDPKYAALAAQTRQAVLARDWSILDQIEAALKTDPQSYDLLTLHGMVEMEQGESTSYDKAEADVDAALKINPDRPEAYIVMGSYYLIAKRSDQMANDERVANAKQAITYFNQAVDRGSTDYLAYWLRFEANQYLADYGGGDANTPAAIMADITHTDSLAPKDFRFYMDAGRYLFDQKNYAAAQKHFEQWLKLNPGDDDAMDYLATTLVILGKQDQVYQLYTSNMTNKLSDPRYMANAAFAAWVNNHKDKAQDWAQTALAVEPNTPAATYVLALLAWDNKTYDQALTLLNTVAQVSADTYHYPFLNKLLDREVNADRARILTATGKLDDAVAAYSQAISADSEWVTPQIEQAAIYIQQGKSDDARTALRNALVLAQQANDQKAQDQIIAMLKQIGGAEPTITPSET